MGIEKPSDFKGDESLWAEQCERLKALNINPEGKTMLQIEREFTNRYCASGKAFLREIERLKAARDTESLRLREVLPPKKERKPERRISHGLSDLTPLENFRRRIGH